jgi:O-antigen ligase
MSGSLRRTVEIAWTATACAAIAVPTLIAFNLPPSSTFFNQAASLVGWGAFLLAVNGAVRSGVRIPSSGLACLLAAMGLLLAAALAAPFWAGLPAALSLSSAGTILAAALVALVGASVAEAGLGREAFRAVCIALVVAGVASSLIGLCQVYAPDFGNGNWIARTAIPGRAVGNMRQPNHLSSLLLWSLIALVWLAESGSVRFVFALPVGLLMLFVVVLTGSRTGTLGAVMLAAWGLLDDRLSRRTRIALLAVPIAYALMWFGALEFAHHTRRVFGSETRFALQDISSSRFGIWSNTLALIKLHPWLGVGFGEFNFAWTLTPFPDRPVAFFDHTHNLPLQLAVELGLPLASLVLALLGCALFRAISNSAGTRRSLDESGLSMRRAALVMLLMVLVHSMLEYPLWYTYFLFPAAFAFGICLGEPPPLPVQPASLVDARDEHSTRPLVIASMLLILGGTLAFYDYMRVVVIFAPPNGAASLADRIEGGRQSVLFPHHADYAAATTVDRPADAMAAFQRATHFLLDARLMMAWATALDEAGETDRARYLAARLREFRNEQAEPFFAACEAPAKAGTKRPFQCDPPVRTYTYADFR